MKLIAIVFLLLVGSAGPVRSATAPLRCEGLSPYAAGICAYHLGEFRAAEQRFRPIVERNEESPITLKARYFLGRSLMKQKRWKEASKQWIELYAISPLFYREWGCDFLLGESRKGMGEP